MQSKLIAVIEGCDIWEHPDGRCSVISRARIDCDGVGDDGLPNNLYNDPYYQPDTTLHNKGQALNALRESYMVLPPAAIKGVKGVVLGCQARVHYLRSGEIKDGVVGDVGPTTKVGELSIAYAQELKMPHDPNTGGEDSFGMVIYEWWPGEAAVVDGETYQLQPYK